MVLMYVSGVLGKKILRCVIAQRETIRTLAIPVMEKNTNYWKEYLCMLE